MQLSKLHLNVNAAPPAKQDLEIIVTKAIGPTVIILFAPVDAFEITDSYEDKTIDPVSVYAKLEDLPVNRYYGII